MLRRIGMFLIVNILVVATLSVIFMVTGLNRYTNEYGLDYGRLAIFSLVVGFAGSFISLGISRMMAKMMYGLQMLKPGTSLDPTSTWILDTVHELARKDGLKVMPEVGVYVANELNAFATGPTRNRSLVAVSTGLINSMDREAAKAVIGHEITHISNGDMVTMTLLQGVINTFVVFFARIAAFLVSSRIRGGGRFFVQLALIIGFQIVFGLLGSLVSCGYSRWREYRADAGGARLAGKENMIRALQALKANQALKMRQVDAYATAQIDAPKAWLRLLGTHPPLDDRIATLQASDGS